MYIIEDTKQKIGQHVLKNEGFTEMGVSVIRNKLPFGDYTTPPSVSVDTKKNMGEIAGNICGQTKEHIRFKQECILARDAGCKLYFLIENECGITTVDEVHNWVNPRCIESPRCVQGPQLEKAMKTMEQRYGCTFLFCRPEEAAEVIIKLLTGRW